MSLLGKNWHLINPDSTKSSFENIVTQRIQALSSEPEDFHDPHLFQDMQKAVTRIREAISHGQRIMIFGDYDVDGITSTAMLFLALRKLGAQVSYRLPHRVNDGYGLSSKFIEEFRELGVKLLITVDCGISCASEISLAKQYGIDTIITDHHSLPANFPADAWAIIHPALESAYPDKNLTGAGVALKLVQALEDNSEDFVALAALGTVADLGKLEAENRLIVRRGLQYLTQTKLPGLQCLLQECALDQGKISSDDLGFRLAPRINAAGRIGDPYIPLNLLVQNHSREKLLQSAQQLNLLNGQRQQLTESIFQEMISRMSPDDALIIAADPQWHIGVLGLVAGKLADRYHRPAIIMQQLDNRIVGSARSPEGFNITQALNDSSDLLTSFGGHAQAAGFNLAPEKLSEFMTKIKAYVSQHFLPIPPSIAIDCQLQPADLKLQFFDQLLSLEPFGIGNPRPTFLLKDCKLNYVEQIGQDKSHLKLGLSNNLEALFFRMAEHFEAISQAGTCDLVVQLDENVWQGSRRLQLKVLDLRLID